MNFNARQIPAPKYWEEFEDLCLALFRHVWDDPNATRNGRSGQTQHGTDISGRPRDAKGTHGVQCKGKDVALGAQIAKDEFDAEVEKAEKFAPALEYWTLATTSPKDARMEEFARKVSAERQQAGKFGVKILFWEDLQSMIADYPDVIERYFPDQSPRMIHLMERLEGAPTSEALANAHVQANEEIEQFLKQSTLQKPIFLTIENVEKDEPVPSSHEEIAKALLAGDALILEAEPGAGKTTSLLQVATRLAELSKDSVPLIVPLAEQLDTKRDLATQIFDRARLRSIGLDTLNNLALQGHFTFLCDGWNERSAEERAWLQTEFGKLRRNYGKCGLLITTRLLSPLFVPDIKKLVIRPLSFDQQLELLKRHDPETAEKLLVAARRIPSLRSVIRNPFYLNALAVVAPLGQLPETKETVLREFVRAHDENPKHRDELHKVFQSNHGTYLCRLATVMTSDGANSIKESRATAVIGQSNEWLVEQKRIEAKSKPGTTEALDALVAHHLLVVLPTASGERVFGFQHQQILEWYASQWLEENILKAHSRQDGEAGETVMHYCNRGDSGEVLLFAVERLGHSDKTAIAALATFILLIFDLDKMLAAEMIRASPDAVWKLIADDIERKLIELSKIDPIAAVRFMGSSERPQFADRLWDAIKNEEQYDRLANVTRGWLMPKSLGPEGIKRVAGLDPKMIRSIVWDFCMYAGDEGVDFSKHLALQIGLPEVVLTVFEHLEFEGADDAAEQFITAVPEKLFHAVAVALPIERARPNIRDRIIAEKIVRASTLSGPQKFHALRELAKAGVNVDSNEMVELALGAGFKEYWQNRDAISFVSERYPAGFQAACVTKLKAGQELPPYADDYIRPEPAQESELLRMFQRQTRSSRREGQIAKTFTRASVFTLLDEMDAISIKIAGASKEDLRAFHQVRSDCVDAVCSANSAEVIEAILSREVTTPEQVNNLSEVLFRLETDSHDKDVLPVGVEVKDRLVKVLSGWAHFFAKPSSTKRMYASHYATALGKVPHPDLLNPFMIALRYELNECEADRAEREQWKTTGKKQNTGRDNCGYWMIYRNAIAKFGGEATKKILVSLLDNTDFGEGAVFELIRFASTKPRVDGFHGSSFGQIKTLRSRNPGKCDPIAAEVAMHIGRLLSSGKREDAAIAVKYATALVQMDFGADAGPIFRAVENAPTAESRYNLLMAMLVFGLEAPPDLMAAGYDAAHKAYFEANWQNPQDWWSVRRWLELLGASDAPERVLGYIEQLPKEHKRTMHLREVANAVGHSPSKSASKVLVSLAAMFPEFVGEHDWQDALLRQNDDAGARYFLDLLLSDTGDTFKGIRSFHAPQVIAALFTSHPKIKEEFIATLRGNARVSPMMAEVARECIVPEDVPDLVEAAKNAGGFLATALIRSVSELAVKREPIEGSVNTYEQRPFDLTALRKRLFTLAHDRGPRAMLAFRILCAIEVQRERYGRPPSETRHPDYESGKQWPMEEPNGE